VGGSGGTGAGPGVRCRRSKPRAESRTRSQIRLQPEPFTIPPAPLPAKRGNQGIPVRAHSLRELRCEQNRLRIEAEVDEFDAGRVPLHAPATITAEGYTTVWRGKVEEIPDEVVGRRLRPGDPGRPIDARVLPIKIALESRSGLKLGQRVEVEIPVHDGP